MKTASIIALVIGALPLVAYPFVLLADVMSLAAQQSGKDPALLTIFSRAFQWTSLAYPVVYVPCAVVALVMLKKMHEKAALGFSLAPMVYVGIVIVLFFAWMNVDKQG